MRQRTNGWPEAVNVTAPPSGETDDLGSVRPKKVVGREGWTFSDMRPDDSLAGDDQDYSLHLGDSAFALSKIADSPTMPHYGESDSDSPVMSEVPLSAPPIGSAAVEHGYSVTQAIGATAAPGAVLSYSLASELSHGSLTINPDGSYTYTAAADYVGQEEFTIRISDQKGGMVYQVVTVDVGNHAPAVGAVSMETAENSSSSTQIVATDNPVDAVSFLLQDASGNRADTITTANGAVVSISPAGVVTYSPGLDFSGNDSYTVVAIDQFGAETLTAVPVNVTPITMGPLIGVPMDISSQQNSGIGAGLGVADTHPGESVTAASLTVIAPEGTIVIVNQTQYVVGPNFSTIELDPAQDWSRFDFGLTPPTGFVGDIQVTLAATAQHGSADPVSRASSFTCTFADIPPTAAATQTADTIHDHQATISMGAMAAAGNTLSYAEAQAPQHGTISIALDGTITYTPTAGYVGHDAFQVTATDNWGGAVTQIIEVNATNAVPEITVAADTAGDRSALMTGLVSATDADGDQVVVTGSMAHGTVVVNADGTYTVIPLADGFVGTDTITFTAVDSVGATTTRTASVTVNNIAPISQGNETALSLAGATATGEWAAMDADGHQLTFSATAASAGAVVINPNTGAWAWTPPNDTWVGTASFVETADDGHGGTTSAVITVVASPAPTMAATLEQLQENWLAAQQSKAILSQGGGWSLGPGNLNTLTWPYEYVTTILSEPGLVYSGGNKIDFYGNYNTSQTLVLQGATFVDLQAGQVQGGSVEGSTLSNVVSVAVDSDNANIIGSDARVQALIATGVNDWLFAGQGHDLLMAANGTIVGGAGGDIIVLDQGTAQLQTDGAWTHVYLHTFTGSYNPTGSVTCEIFGMPTTNGGAISGAGIRDAQGVGGSAVIIGFNEAALDRINLTRYLLADQVNSSTVGLERNYGSSPVNVTGSDASYILWVNPTGHERIPVAVLVNPVFDGVPTGALSQAQLDAKVATLIAGGAFFSQANDWFFTHSVYDPLGGGNPAWLGMSEAVQAGGTYQAPGGVNVTVYGNGQSTIVAGTGDDTLVGAVGVDGFVIDARTSGMTTLRGLEAQDHIELRDVDLSQAVLRQVGANVVIDIGAKQVAVLEGVSISDAANFQFTIRDTAGETRPYALAVDGAGTTASFTPNGAATGNLAPSIDQVAPHLVSEATQIVSGPLAGTTLAVHNLDWGAIDGLDGVAGNAQATLVVNASFIQLHHSGPYGGNSQKCTIHAELRVATGAADGSYAVYWIDDGTITPYNGPGLLLDYNDVLQRDWTGTLAFQGVFNPTTGILNPTDVIPASQQGSVTVSLPAGTRLTQTSTDYAWIGWWASASSDSAAVAPVAGWSATPSVVEHASVGTAIASISATDPDGDPVTLRLASSSVPGLLALQGDQLIVTGDISAISSPTITVVIEATDRFGATSQRTEVITVIAETSAPDLHASAFLTPAGDHASDAISSTDPAGAGLHWSIVAHGYGTASVDQAGQASWTGNGSGQADTFAVAAVDAYGDRAVVIEHVAGAGSPGALSIAATQTGHEVFTLSDVDHVAITGWDGPSERIALSSGTIDDLSVITGAGSLEISAANGLDLAISGTGTVLATDGAGTDLRASISGLDAMTSDGSNTVFYLHGQEIVIGGAGQDIFWLTAPATPGHAPVINGFDQVNDRILLPFGSSIDGAHVSLAVSASDSRDVELRYEANPGADAPQLMATIHEADAAAAAQLVAESQQLIDNGHIAAASHG